MKIETVMWLLPIVFMFHDFEEIIMTKPWIIKNLQSIRTRFPKQVSRSILVSGSLSTPAFALAAAEEFVVITGLTYIGVERGYISMWVGLLMGFTIHLFVHIAQFIAFRKYTPAIITSPLAALYGLWTIAWMSSRNLFDWRDAGLWTGVMLLVIVGNLLFALWLAAKFDHWLNQSFAG